MGKWIVIFKLRMIAKGSLRASQLSGDGPDERVSVRITPESATQTAHCRLHTITVSFKPAHACYSSWIEVPISKLLPLDSNRQYRPCHGRLRASGDRIRFSSAVISFQLTAKTFSSFSIADCSLHFSRNSRIFTSKAQFDRRAHGAPSEELLNSRTLAGTPAHLKALMPEVYRHTPVRPPLRKPAGPASAEPDAPHSVRVIHRGGIGFTSQRRARGFVAKGYAVWAGDAIRFIDNRMPAQSLSKHLASRVEACAAVAAKRWELERAELERSAPGSHSDAEWNSLLAIYGHRCLRCGIQGVRMTKDHVIPLSEGGSNSASNLQPLCLPCNSWKGARIIDFRPRVLRIT